MSIDVGLLARMIVDAFEKKEEFESQKGRYVDLQGIVNVDDYERIGKHVPSVKVSTIVNVMISITIGIIAFYLSWSCNTSLGYNMVVKSIFGTLAFTFGLIYIALYMLFRYDTCKKLM